MQRRCRLTRQKTGGGGYTSGLTAVTCPSRSECVAVGYYYDKSNHIQGLLLIDSSGRWSPAEARLPAGAPLGAALNAVACPAATSCVAVGMVGEYQPDSQGLIETWSGKKWASAVAPLPDEAGGGASQARLTSVACPMATECVAAGTDNADGLLVTGWGNSWTPAVSPPPAGASSLSLNSIACAPDVNTSCTAVGANEGADDDGLLVAGIGTWWSQASAPLPKGGRNLGGYLAAVEPVPGAGYIAVGSYFASSGAQEGLLITGNDVCPTYCASTSLPS
jgi:hypothetical protein